MGLRYIGTSFIRGVPARDLTDEEAEAFGRERLLGTGLYVGDAIDAPIKQKKVGKKKSKEAVKREDEDSSEVTKWLE